MNRQQRRARPHGTDTAEACNERGISLARVGQLDAAVAALQLATTLRPGYARAHNNLGIVLVQQGRLQEATAAFRAALAYDPTLAEAQNNLGNVLTMQDRLDEAVACFRRAARLKPDYAQAQNNLGIALMELGKLDEAVSAYRQALRLQPGYAEAENNLGIARVYEGRLDDAEAAFERALTNDSNASAYLNLAQIRKFSATDPAITAMEGLLAKSASMPADSRIALHFALAKAYDDCNEPAQAAPHLLQGNAFKRRQLAYDEAATLAAMQRTQGVFDAALMRRLRGRGAASALPVFILGMPRSGSTLVEQILASHRQVCGAGERSDFSRLAASLLPAPCPDGAGSLLPDHLRRLGTRYLAGLPSRPKAALRMTDKMPGNFLTAGLIHLALPDAKIIHTRRDAADTCFSCFTKLFRAGHAYTFDLGELGRYYRAYERLMAHWRSVIPAAALLEIDYEDLVADPKAQIARLLDHCGIGWDDRCLAFDTTQRVVRTASASQVREPIHARSIGRWRRYADLLQPLLGELAEGKNVLF